MAKKVKLDFWSLNTYLNSIGNSLYEESSMSIKKKDGTVVKGIGYKLSNPLRDEEKAWIMQWKNTELFIAQAEYAPEIKANVVFIGDKKVRE